MRGLRSRAALRQLQTGRWRFREYPEFRSSSAGDVRHPQGAVVRRVPILAFFLFYYLTGILWADASETAKVLFGVGGIAVGFAVNFALKNKTREYPEITKVLSPKS